jgi:hypothetical protein
VDLLADGDAVISGYRILISPYPGIWLASEIQYIDSGADAGTNATGVLEDAVHTANACCPALKTTMKAAFTMPMWGCGKAPQPG